MRNDNAQLNDILQREYSRLTGYYTSIEVPDKATFEIDGYLLRVKYPSELVMKDIEAFTAFEGWMNICFRWGVFDEVVFSWEVPEAGEIDSKIYQDFLYRVKHFSLEFRKWFSLSKESLKLIVTPPRGYVSDKLILERIIDVSYYFETGKRVTIEIPVEINVSILDGVVGIETTEEGGEALDGADNLLYNPWQLIINRWAYLPTAPKSAEQTITPIDEMPDVVKELIKVGFTERNLPFPEEQ